MNLHAPQTEEARSEAENILKVDYNIITPRYGLSIIGETKDALFGTYILTDKLEFTREQGAELLISAGKTALNCTVMR